jgi:hypothetical protein
MVDEVGQLLDEPRHAVQNIGLFRRLTSHGVQVNIFRPAAPLQMNNRLHCKIAAIAGHTVFLGGSNIGDYSPPGRSNRRVRRLRKDLPQRVRFSARSFSKRKYRRTLIGYHKPVGW